MSAYTSPHKFSNLQKEKDVSKLDSMGKMESKQDLFYKETEAYKRFR